MPQYEYDKFGYCILCSKQVTTQIVQNGKNIIRKLKDWDEEEVVLNDNSNMRICVCKECKHLVSDNLQLIMDKVYKGWEHDIVEAQWPEDKKEMYLNRYKGIRITGIA